MRHETHAYRVVYGNALFVTFSPNEKDSLLMLRLSRTRRCDPVNITDELSRQWGGASLPSVERDVDVMGVPIEPLCQQTTVVR